MTSSDDRLELEDERAAQKRYTRRVQERARSPIRFEGAQNTIWTGDGRPKLPPVPLGSLLGRVALTHSEALLGERNDFYIGDQHLDLDGVEVFSWAAPVACTFYRGSNHHEWCDEVAVVRSFAHGQDGSIHAFSEDVLIEDAIQIPFRKRTLTIDASVPTSTSPRRPLPRKSPPVDDRAMDDGSQPRDESRQPLASHATAAAPTRGNASSSVPSIRAESVLRAKMSAPRGRVLRPVLATLQPDQYEMVTIPASKNAVIEGQPGTGKTIVASHRAAYLLNSEAAENGTDGHVLVVGPTYGYSVHIRNVVRDLCEDTSRIHVLSLPELVTHLLQLREPPRGPVSNTWQDADWQLGSFARAAVNRLRVKSDGFLDPGSVYDYLRSNGGSDAPLAIDAEWHWYLVGLPSALQDAQKLRVHSAMLAVMQVAIKSPASLARISHVIVDEAQDVTPLEWILLEAINPEGTWTLLGDLNQRRSDHTLASWEQVTEEMLALSDETILRKRLERGYRSTKPILEYANRLLPRAERAVLAFQESGPEPTVLRATEKVLAVTIESEIRRLLKAYPDGTHAVVSPRYESVRTLLRKAGWTMRIGDVEFWELNGRSVRVVGPNAARGLEYDAVVVVEPADFPSNFGRQGPLYTSLTRANRELSVVHTKALPDALRH